MKRILIAISLLTLACGAGTPSAPTVKADAVPSTPLAAVCTALTHASPTSEGPYLDLVLSEPVARVDAYRQDNSGVEAPAGKQFWEGDRHVQIEAWFESRYRVVVTCRNGATQQTFLTVGKQNTGGSSLRPATCSLQAFDVSWADTQAASAADEDTATVTLRPGYTGTVPAFLSSYDGDGTKVHGPLAVTLPGAVAIHLAHRQTAGWRVELTCADGSLLSQAAGAW